MWIVYLALAAALGFLGVKIWRVETEHPFRNPRSRTPSPMEEVAPRIGSGGSTHVKRFSARENLLTPAEASFFGVLRVAMGEEHYVFSKVRMADLLQPTQQDPSARQKAFNQISAKHLDFVICHASTFEIFAAVELDDSSHKEAARLERDAFMNESFQQAGIPLIRIPARLGYSVEEIRTAFQKARGLSPSAAQEFITRPARSTDEPAAALAA